MYNTPTAKLFIGLVQIWMVTELALRLNTCITLANNHRAKITFTDQVLVKVQAVYMATIAAFFVVILSCEIYLCLHPDDAWLDPVRVAIAFGFLLEFLLLGAVNLFLIVQLRTIGRLMGHDDAFFRKERQSMIITFVVFNFGYLIRFVWDEWYVRWEK